MDAAQLTDAEEALMTRLHNKIRRKRDSVKSLDKYREGVQRLEHLGLAVPPELRAFETVINIPRMAVEEVKRRMEVRALISGGGESDDEKLRAIWNRSKMDSQFPLLLDDALTYGIGYVSIAADNQGRARIIVEHAPDMAVTRDVRTQAVTGALRVYRSEDEKRVEKATLYLPDQTILLSKDKGAWTVEQRLPHTLGTVPVVAVVNRQRTGSHRANGVTEMADVIGMTDGIARIVTNMQVAIETAALPQKWAAGLDKSNFVDDKTGRGKTRWETYFQSVWATPDKDVKFGSFQAGDISQFTKAVDRMMVWCAVMLGLPTRYAGNDTANPATEGAIKADEARLVKNCEDKARSWGDEVSQIMAIAASIDQGEIVDSADVRIEWHDPSTPTLAQKADALQKLAGGKPLLSVQGVWDELGWSEARKSKEREYLMQEATDPDWLAISEKEMSLDVSAGA